MYKPVSNTVEDTRHALAAEMARGETLRVELGRERQSHAETITRLGNAVRKRDALEADLVALRNSYERVMADRDDLRALCVKLERAMFVRTVIIMALACVICAIIFAGCDHALGHRHSWNEVSIDPEPGEWVPVLEGSAPGWTPVPPLPRWNAPPATAPADPACGSGDAPPPTPTDPATGCAEPPAPCVPVVEQASIGCTPDGFCGGSVVWTCGERTETTDVYLDPAGAIRACVRLDGAVTCRDWP
jgi:hypothetical protein